MSAIRKMLLIASIRQIGCRIASEVVRLESVMNCRIFNNIMRLYTQSEGQAIGTAISKIMCQDSFRMQGIKKGDPDRAAFFRDGGDLRVCSCLVSNFFIFLSHRFFAT